MGGEEEDQEGARRVGTGGDWGVWGEVGEQRVAYRALDFSSHGQEKHAISTHSYRILTMSHSMSRLYDDSISTNLTITSVEL